MGLIVGAASALYLQVKTVFKQIRQPLRQLLCTGLIATHQSLSYRPGLCP